MKNQQEPLYHPVPFFMIRAPLLPIELFFEMLGQENLQDYLFNLYETNPQIQQAILIASASLDDALQNIEAKTAKEKEQICSSLLKYILRMATRPTPFGLFAFVAMGRWGEEANIGFDHSAIKQRARPDMEWFFALVDRLCSYAPFFSKLPIRKNPLTTYSAGRYTLDYVRKTEDDKEQKKLSIRATPLTATLLKITTFPLPIEEVVKRVVELHPTLEGDKIIPVISSLLEQQFLISYLHPTLLTTTPFEDLLKKLSSFPLENTPFAPLNDVSQAISQYNEEEVKGCSKPAIPAKNGKPAERFRALQELMKTLAASPHYLQVDAGYQAKEKATLPKDVSCELARTAELLWKINYKKEREGLNEYREKFLERYSGRLVPLLELFSEHGLGAPSHYLDPVRRNSGNRTGPSKFSQWLMQEYCSCLHENRSEIVLTEGLIAQLIESPSHYEEASSSFDLFFEVIAESKEKVEEGDFLLYLSQSTFQGGSILGRFTDLLDNDSRDSLQQFIKEEEDQTPDLLFVETSYLSMSSRTANVAMNPNFRRYQLDLNNAIAADEKDAVHPQQIFLEDILVGVSAGKFFLKHKELDKQLVFTSTNVLNYLFAPSPIRFIRDVSMERGSSVGTFSWESLDAFPYLPRVRFEKSILSPAKWNVNLALIQATNKESVESIGQKFHLWAERWHLPRYLFLTSNDNRILLDRNHPQHRNEIAHRLKKDPMIKLLEKIGQEKGTWVTSDLGHHLTEFVATFIKNKAYAPPAPPSSSFVYQPIPSSKRKMLFGSEWLYVKFYLSRDNEIRFLIQFLVGLTQYLRSENIIQDWFFVRYSDPSPHIRVRFRVRSEEAMAKLIPLLHQWSHGLYHDQLFSDIQIAIYDREIERYGGEQLIQEAEAFFCADSETAVLLLQLLSNDHVGFPDYVAGAMSVIDLLNGFGMTIDDMRKFLEPTPKDELKGFREWKNTLSALARSYFQFSEASADAAPLNQAFQRRKEAQRLLTQKLGELDQQGLLTHSPTAIQDSIIHMHCNRLMGTSHSLERKARLFALNTLESLRFSSKAGS